MFDCKIVFSGLCGFVFDQPIFDANRLPPQPQDQPTRATVLLPNLLLSRVVQRPNLPPEQIDAHFPQLVFDLANLDAKASSVQPDMVRQDNANNKSQALVLLYERLVTFQTGHQQPGAAPAMKVVNPPLNGQPTPPTDSVWWLASVADPYPTTQGRIDPGLLSEQPYANGSIIARLELAEGELSTEALSADTCKFVDPEPGKPFDRQIATSLSLRIQGINNGITFLLQKAGMPVEKLVLRAKSGELRVDIKNSELDGFAGMPKDMVYVPKRYEAEFEVYREMAAGFLPGGSLSILQRKPGLETVHNGLCPPGAFTSKPLHS